MINIKKMTAALLAASMAATLTGCGENTTWGADIDGQRIPAGVLIYFLQTSYYDAQSKLYEEASEASGDETGTGDITQTDVYTSQIEGKNGRDWVYDDATKQMQIYAAVESRFDEYGLTLTDEERDSAELYCDQLWDNGGEDYYSSMGISRDSYISIYLNNEKRSKLFEYLYSEGGEYGVPDSDVKTYLSENYALINYIDMELKDGEGNLLKSDGKAERMAMAQEYVERYKNGEDFDSLNAEYVTYYQRLQEDAAANAEGSTTEAGNTETGGDGLFGGGMAEVSGSDAEAADGGDGEGILPDESSEDETAAETSESAAETTAPAGETTTAAETSAVPDSSASETETTPAGSTSEAETTGGTPDLSDMNMDDLISVNTVDSNRTIIEKDGTEPNETVRAKVFDEMSNGDIEIIETPDGEHYFVVLKIDILEDSTYFDAAKTSLLFEMKSEDYDALIDTWVSAQSISKNEESYKRYDPKKMMEA